MHVVKPAGKKSQHKSKSLAIAAKRALRRDGLN